MAQGDAADLLSFRRTFGLLLLLVVLPSAGLSGFGVLAIINERAAVEKRLEAVWAGRLQTTAQALDEALEQLRLTRDSPFTLKLGEQVLTDTPFKVVEGAVDCADPRLKAALSGVVNELKALPPQPLIFSVADAQDAFMIAAHQREGHIEGARLSREGLGELLAERAPPSDGAHLELRPSKRQPPEGLMARFVSGVADVREAALGGRELASLALRPPRQDFRLVALAEGEDPVAASSTRNRTVYGVLLGLFYLTLVLGVVYTGRALYREARLSRLKTDFVSLVSHELRTPLTSIRMFIETLALHRVRDEAETQQVLGLLTKETERLSTLIENVLDWARIEQGRKQYRLTRQSPERLISSAVDAFKTQRLGAELELKVDVPQGLPEIDVDSDALAGALLNLLNNAYKYTGPNKHIAVRARREKKGVAIDVQDNGVGIPKGERRRIFERFYRIDNLLSRNTEGSGLGLSIAERIIKAHGGHISIQSTLGEGSTFTLHLPAA